jgi:hypothetical protein
MADDWVARGVRAQREGLAKSRQTAQYEQNARAHVGSMFEALRNRVEADVQAYNLHMPSGRPVSFEGRHGEHFSVAGPHKTVTVTRPPEPDSTAIQWTFQREVKDGIAYGSVEVAANKEGHVRFRSPDGQKFHSVDEVSEMILRPVLFGDI